MKKQIFFALLLCLSVMTMNQEAKAVANPGCKFQNHSSQTVADNAKLIEPPATPNNPPAKVIPASAAAKFKANPADAAIGSI